MSRAARSIVAALIVAALSLPVTAAAQPPPTLVLSYYSARDLARIVDLLGRSGMPADEPVWYGNYYGTSPPKKPGQHHGPPLPPVSVPNGHQAPIFSFAPTKFWLGRSLHGTDARAAGGGLTGAAPPLYKLLSGSARARLAWGRELGQRFRDRVRTVRAGGTAVDGWQFDEIPSNAIGPQGRAVRELVRGMLTGLEFGRPQLGDQPEQGIVFMANRALELSSVRSGDVGRFWSSIDGAASLFAGEEYPKYAGDPERAAFVQGAGQRHLEAGSAAMRALAARYVVGISPGYLPALNLGGNVDGKSPEGAADWRAAFLAERARMGVAGFALYNLRARNSASAVLGSTFEAIAGALGSAP